MGNKMENMFLNRLLEIVGEENVKVDEPMSMHTTFRIGGPADYFVTPEKKEQVSEIVTACKEAGISYYVIGNGSNLLVGDFGYRGLILQIGNKMSELTVEAVDETHKRVTSGAGLMLSRLASAVVKESLRGFEFASGIPGTLGGAVAMNAGAYGGEIKDNIVSAVVMDKTGEILTLTKEELELGYRTSVIQTQGYIVLEATFEFEEGNKEESTAEIAELTKKRREKQPLEFPSAGSTFKRPEGYFAGKLIMDCGLRGFRVGNIMVSEKHCGFVINAGGGTAKEALTLIDEVSRRVFEQFGVNLEPEVRMIGEFYKEK